tara:strand:- start:2407 stop:3660 length:1254 start_codon:yes stop_codon:yes gene_type:complete
MISNLLQQKHIVYFLFYITFIISFILGENSSSGAAQDHFSLQIFQEQISNNINSGINFFIEKGQGHSPVFYIIKSIFENIIGKPGSDIFFLTLGFFIPVVFYTILKKNFREVDKKLLFAISLILYLSPYVRSSAVWATNDNFAILFFLLSLSKFINFEKKNNKSDIIYSFLYLVIAAYVRQYFIMIFIIYGIFLLRNNSIKFILYLVFFNIILLTPWFFYLYKQFYFNLFLTTYEENYISSGFLKPNLIYNFLIFCSMYLFYILPFVLNMDLYKKIKSYISDHKIYLLIFLSIFIIIYIQYKLPFNQLGGGAFYKISLLINSKLFFISSSFAGLLLILLTVKINFRNLIVLIIFFFMFPFIVIYQKYYDPMMLIIFFGLIKSDLIYEQFKKKKINMKIVFTFFLLFLIGSNIYYFYK